MFWKAESCDRRAAKRAGLRAHRALFNASPAAMPGKIKAVNCWNGVYDHPKPKPVWSDLFEDVNVYVAKLEKRGFEKVGGGAFSWVYGKPDCSTVVKVCHCGDTDPWPLFAAWAHANPSPFLPAIHSFKRHTGFYVAVIERLEKTVSATPYEGEHMTAAKALRDYVHGNEKHRVAAAIQQTVMALYPGIAEVLDGMKAEFAEVANWDMHAGNWMLRKGGSLVITDPISAKGDSSEKLATVTRIKGSKRVVSA